jgi:rRNA-processing protein FCF1
MSEDYVELYEKATVVAMARFQKRFHKYYKNLKQLSIDIPIKNFVESNAPEKAVLQTLANKLSKRLILEWKAYNSGLFNGVINILFPGRAKQLISRNIMDDLQKQLDLQKADILKNLKFRTKQFKKKSKNNIVKPSVKKYVNEYKNIINAIICTNDQRCEELKKKHCSIFDIRKSLESTKKELEVEKEGIDTLQRLILSITDGSFRIGESGWDDIDTLKLLTNRYDYKKGLEHIFETIDPILHHHNYSYLWGCLSRLFNRDPRGHYLRFINHLKFYDDELLPRTIDHLEQNDFAGLESIHPNLDYARSDSLLAAKLYDVFIKHDRAEISREIHANHCLKLLSELDSHTKRLLEQCNRMPL